MPLSPVIQEYVDRNIITLQRANDLTMTQRQALDSQFTRALIAANVFTVEYVLDLEPTQQITFASEPIHELINEGIFTVAQALHFGFDQQIALDDLETRQRLRAGGLTIEDIMGDYARDFADRALDLGDAPLERDGIAYDLDYFHEFVLEFAPNLNGAQSTHNASVHQAVSESATRLANRYLGIDGADLEHAVAMVQGYVNGLSDESPKHTAAKQCVLRITASNDTWTDPGSHLTTRQLLALTFLAMHDEGNRIGQLRDAEVQFIEGLYEIQRGYNLSDSGVDQGGPDRFICAAGTFNKLIEKLQGIHPDCQIRFITKEIASLKLPVVVREEAMRYLRAFAYPNTATELCAFTQLMAQVKENGVEVIWDQIEGHVADRMFAEFDSLYRDRTDRSFIDLMEAGQYVELPHVSVFQEAVQKSPGYQHYCSQMIRQSGLFFSQKSSVESLAAHRQDGQECSKNV